MKTGRWSRTRFIISVMVVSEAMNDILRMLPESAQALSESVNRWPQATRSSGLILVPESFDVMSTINLSLRSRFLITSPDLSLFILFAEDWVMFSSNLICKARKPVTMHKTSTNRKNTAFLLWK